MYTISNKWIVKIPENHIVIDFDIKDKDGNESLSRHVHKTR